MSSIPQNHRLTILSIVTLALLVVASGILVFGSGSPKQDRVLNAVIVILGAAALWWKAEYEGRRTRNDTRSQIQPVVLQAQEVSAKAELVSGTAAAAAAVTVESFEAVKAELLVIKQGINGELDQRIVRTVTAVVAEQLPIAVETALEHKLEPAIERICQKLLSK